MTKWTVEAMYGAERWTIAVCKTKEQAMEFIGQAAYDEQKCSGTLSFRIIERDVKLPGFE